MIIFQTKFAFLTISLFLLSMSSHAQEISARGLSSNMEFGHLIEQTRSLAVQLQDTQKRLSAIEHCAKIHMLYQPDHSNSDSQGCMKIQPPIPCVTSSVFFRKDFPIGNAKVAISSSCGDGYRGITVHCAKGEVTRIEFIGSECNSDGVPG